MAFFYERWRKFLPFRQNVLNWPVAFLLRLLLLYLTLLL